LSGLCAIFDKEPEQDRSLGAILSGFIKRYASRQQWNRPKFFLRSGIFPAQKRKQVKSTRRTVFYEK
jgi:hypothetical protein